MTAPSPFAPVVLAEALSETHSPSDALAYALDVVLLAHPERCLTDADYAWWTPAMGCVAAPGRAVAR